MTFILFILATLLGAAATMSAVGKLTKKADVMAIMEHVGVKADMIPVLGLLEIAGAVGLLAGIWNKPLGVAAAVGLTLYFAGAIIAHLRKKDAIKDFGPALGLTVFSLLVVLLELAR
jgi:hypothetical protein